MNRHIEQLRRHVKDQTAEVEQLALTWERQRDADKGKFETVNIYSARSIAKIEPLERLSKQQSTSEQLQTEASDAESADLTDETAKSMGFSKQQKAATFAKLVEHAAAIQALKNELNHRNDAAEKAIAAARGEMEAAIAAIGQRDQQIEDLRRAKDEADGKLFSQSKFFIAYFEAAYSVTGLEIKSSMRL